MRKLALLTALVLGFGAPLAQAHHGWSGYDSSKLVTLTGTVEQASYGNPHCLLVLRAADKTWRIVLAPPTRMQARQVPQLAANEAVSVEGYPHRQEMGEFRAERIVIAGKAFELR